jgi:hypothetical protein
VIKERGDRNRVQFSIVAGAGTFMGKNTEEYVAFIHEGVYRLGPGSIAKQRGSKRVVGRKFLERALKEREPMLRDEIEAAMMKVIPR